MLIRFGIRSRGEIAPGARKTALLGASGTRFECFSTPSETKTPCFAGSGPRERLPDRELAELQRFNAPVPGLGLFATGVRAGRLTEALSSGGPDPGSENPYTMRARSRMASPTVAILPSALRRRWRKAAPLVATAATNGTPKAVVASPKADCWHG